ncbi:MAG TPA: hypothetical protein VFS20_16330 [Longimicrobium sp.]|nr:hypothetical protein [Longimicrobium sp.]
MSREDEIRDEVREAEQEMVATVLYEVFLDVLGQGDPVPWAEPAAWRLSRGASAAVLKGLRIAHAAGTRIGPCAAALGEAIESMLLTDRNRTGPRDYPTELAVLVVDREPASRLLERVRSGLYNSTGDAFSSAVFALSWTENDPRGKLALLRHAVEEADAGDADGGELIPAEDVFQRARERHGGG